MKFLFKAKKYLVGTRRRWREGTFIKVAEKVWKKESDPSRAPDKYRQKLSEALEVYNLDINTLDKSTVAQLLNDVKKIIQIDDWKSFWDEWAEYAGEEVPAKHKKVVEYAASHLLDEEPPKEKKPKPVPKSTKTVPKKHEGPGVRFTNPARWADVKRLLINKKISTERARQFYDDKPAKMDRYSAKDLLGQTVEMHGIRGVVKSYHFMRTTRRAKEWARYHGLPEMHNEGMVVDFVLCTPERDVKVSTDGRIKILGDPTGPVEEVKSSKGMEKAGIAGIAFDEGIGDWEKKSWIDSLDKAFSRLNETLGLSMNGKVKIQVYGKRGVRRGAVADYHSTDKTIRLSASKAGSKSALAHELGHALDDKINGWKGTGLLGWGLAGELSREIVAEFRRSKQGQIEAEQLKVEKHGLGGDIRMHGWQQAVFGVRRRRVSNHTSWMNKPQEVFARCFESYVARKVPSWESFGWAKAPVEKDQEGHWEKIAKLFDRLLSIDVVKKSLDFILR